MLSVHMKENQENNRRDTQNTNTVEQTNKRQAGERVKLGERTNARMHENVVVKMLLLPWRIALMCNVYPQYEVCKCLKQIAKSLFYLCVWEL